MTNFTTAVAASADDVTETAAGTMHALSNTSLIASFNNYHIATRFQNITIPPGSTVTAAALHVFAESSSYDDPNGTFYGEDADNAGAFSTTGSDISNRTKTTASVGWATTAIGTGDSASPDLSAIIQEIIDRGGWSSGNALVVMFKASTSSPNLRIRSYDYGSNIPYIDITYSPPSGSETITVATGNDDGGENTGGTVNLTTSSVDLDSAGDVGGFIARGVSIPPGSHITAAHINLWPNNSDRQSPNFAIKGQADPAALSTTAYDFSSRTLTTAAATWNASNVGYGSYVASPDISAVIQEIVDDDDWTAAEDIGIFLVQSSSSGWFRFSTYNDSAAHAPQLYVAWEPATGTVTGTAAITLGAATLSAAGKVAVKGAAAITLSDIVEPELSIFFAFLGRIDATGKLAIKGQSAVTLGNATLSAAGKVAVKGAAAITLGDATLSATGSLDSSAIAGSSAVTLADATLSASGVLPITGSATTTLDDATLAAGGVLAIAGTAAVGLDDATLAGAGVLPLVGTAAANLADATLSATGALAVEGSGTVNVTLDAATVAVTGVIAIAGAASLTLGDATLSAVATLADSGASALVLADATTAATGALAIAATASLALDDATVSALGYLAIEGAGSVIVTLSDAALAATGTLLLAATASVTLEDATLDSTAVITQPTGTAAIILDGAVLAATGALQLIAISSVTLGNVTLAAGGSLALAAMLNVVLGDATLAAYGSGAEQEWYIGAVTSPGHIGAVSSPVQMGLTFSPGHVGKVRTAGNIS